MKEKIASLLAKQVHLSEKEVYSLIEVPPSPQLGDYSFPCFSLAKSFKKSPIEIASELSKKIQSKEFEKIESAGPYINFFVDRDKIAKDILGKILKEKEKYGSSKFGKGKKIVIDMSSPNIAKPFGIGHLRSTIIGNSIANISKFQGYAPVKINYLGDWGTQFGKMIVGYKKKGNEKKLKTNPIKHLLELYVEGNKEEYEDEAREWFRKLESGDKEAVELWKKFRKFSLEDFDKLYKILGVKFDVISGESLYNTKMAAVVDELRNKGLLQESDGAEIVDLKKYNLGVCLIKKKDGATLYATRDITAALDRYKKYKFHKMIYEVGQEQKLHFQQFFKVLELMGYSWAKDCVHVYHGLYLAPDGKKFATRQGKTVFMEDILNETINLAKSEIKKREKLSEKELNSRARAIAIAAIFYGDLKNFRGSDIVFDINRFISFEGNTGPYVLYTYARAKSLLRKAGKKTKSTNLSLTDKEKSILVALSKFPEISKRAADELSPNFVANYAYELAQSFNEFYHSEKVIGSENEYSKLQIVQACAIVLQNALGLLGIKTLEVM